MADVEIVDLDPKLSVDGTEVVEVQNAAGGLGSSFKTPLSNLIGPEGPAGTDGSDGTPATADAGSTTTLAPGSSATVSNSGTTSDAVFDFGIPEGEKGDTGTAGTDGNDGTAATVDAGTTTTGAPGSSANVTNVGTTAAAVFNFTIPSGLPGADGSDGTDGVGIPVAGGTGQVLIKASAADYDTVWSTPAGGGDVTGPASSINNHIATFNGTTGKLIRDSGSLLSSFATATQGATADTAIQPGDNVSTLNNDAGYLDDATAFASAAQGLLADTATQPGDDISTLTNDEGFKRVDNGTALPVDGTGYNEGDVFLVYTP